MKKITLLIMLFVISLSANAQVVAYGFTQSSGAYTEITGGTVLGAEASDDQRFVDPAVPLGAFTVTGVGFPIGFNFVFNGDVYDRFAVNNNGWISLGKSSLGAAAVNNNTSSAYTPLGTTVATVTDELVARIAGLGRDLQGQPGSTLRFELSGTAPNQVLTIQWKNYRKYSATGDVFNFQIKLYETINLVQVVYGSFTCNATTNTFETGLRGSTAANATNYASRTSTTSWSATTGSVAANGAVTMLGTNVPANGLTFTWSPPACPGAVGLTTTNITNAAATITWNQPTPIPANGYEYVVSTTNITPTAPGIVSATNVANITGLSSNTVHYVFVRTDCGSGVYGNWVLMGTFRTLCDGVTDFIQNFDTSTTGIGNLPACWDRAGTSANVFTTTGSVAPMSPANRLFMSITATTTAFAILPPVTNLQADSHKLRFKAFATATLKKIRVGYFTNPADVATFVLIQEFDLPSTAATTAQEFTVIPTAIPVGVNRLVLTLPSGTATTAYVDDVKWEVNSSCLEPTALSTSSVTNTSAQLTWVNGGPETEWQVQYGALGFALGSGTLISSVTTNPYLLSGLTTDTPYQYYVRAVCTGTIYSSWSGPFAFRTLCNSVTDFIQTFDTTPTGVGNLPPCWRASGTGNAYNTTGSVAPMSSANRLYMNISATTTAFATMPPVSNLQAETHRLKFKAYATTTLKKIRVGYFTNPADVSTFVFIEEIDLPSTAATAIEFTVIPYLGSVPGVTNLVFALVPGAATTVYVDDVKWEENSSCVEPTALNVLSLTNTSAQLNWVNGGGEAEWQVQYGLTGFTLGTGTNVTGITTNPYNLTGLTPNTSYQYFVRGVCPGSQFSSWSGPFTFKTLCNDVTSFTETFDTYTSGVNSLPDCWSRAGSSTTTYITTGAIAPMSPTNRLYMFANTGSDGYAIMPPVSNLQANTHRLRFSAFATASPRDLIVGYLTNPADTSSFTALQTFTIAGTVIANTQEYIVYPTTVPAGVKNLAFKNTGFTGASSTFYIDNVSWEIIPACSNPSGPSSSAVTSNSAVIAWTSNPTDISWEIEYGVTGFTLGTGTIVPASTNPFTLTSLASSTVYQFYVRSICAGPITSTSSFAGTFTTLCAPFTPNYTQNFATFPPICWTRADAGTIATGPIGTGAGYWLSRNFLNTAALGLGVVANLYQDSRIAWLVSPIFNLSAGGYQVKYDVGATDYFNADPAVFDADDKVDFLMSVDGGATWTSLELFNAANAPTNTSTTKVYNIPTVTSSNVLFAFRADEGALPTSTDWDFFVDNFKVETPPTAVPACATNVVATQPAGCGNFPITITWDATTGALGYLLKLGTTVGGTEIANNVNLGNVLSYVYNAANPSTTYYYTITPYNSVGNAVGCSELNIATPATICVCTPIYTSGVTASDYFSSFIVQGTTLNNNSGTSTSAPSYNYYTGLPNYTATFTQGASYVAEVLVGFTSQGFSVWIDFDNNGTYSEAERVGSSVANIPTPGGTFGITIPCGANPGLHRMRVRMVYATTGNTIDPCNSYAYGEAEDYDVTIAPVVTPTGAASQTFCAADGDDIADLVVTGTNLVWYDAATAGNVLPTTTLLTATTYYVASVSGTCESPRLAVTTTADCSTAPCLTSVNGQWPTETFVPNSALCDGYTAQEITNCGFASQYSVVTVVSGQTYTFASSVTSDVITISADSGATSVATGIGSVTWLATISGNVRFYTHTAGCGAQNVCRTKTVACGAITTDSPDYVNLQFPATINIVQGGSDTVYGQVYEGGLTDVVPNIVGQAPGITAWVGISPVASNTNPNTWTNWVPATWNSGYVNNNDEYQATIGATLTPGTYYYATRFRLNSGAYVYGGIDSSNNGNFWNGTTHNSGVLTVAAPPAPANDLCSGAFALTPGGVFADNVQSGTIFGATTTSGVVPSCQADVAADVWYSVIVPASGSVTIETQVATSSSLTDSIIAAFSGTCGSLTQIACDDDGGPTGANTLMSVMSLSALTPGSTIYVGVWKYTPNASNSQFQVSAYDASLSTDSFDNSNFTFYPNPVKDVLNLSYSENITKVQVINLLGQEVITNSLNATQGQVDMSNLPTGTYLVKVTANDKVKTIKVIKQ